MEDAIIDECNDECVAEIPAKECISKAVQAPQVECRNIQCKVNECVDGLGDEEQLASALSENHISHTPRYGTEYHTYNTYRDECFDNEETFGVKYSDNESAEQDESNDDWREHHESNVQLL